MTSALGREWLLRTARMLGLVCATAWLGGCALGVYRSGVIPGQGILFQSFKAPLTVNATGNPAGPDIKKTSSARTTYFHDVIFSGLDFAWDGADIEAIARRGGIEHISYADYEVLNILGIYATFTVHVYGY